MQSIKSFFFIIFVLLLTSCGKSESKNQAEVVKPKLLFVYTSEDHFDIEQLESKFDITHSGCEYRENSEAAQECADMFLESHYQTYDICVLDPNIQSTLLNDFITDNCIEIE